GIHYVGQMQEGSLMRFLVDQLTDGQLEWAPLPATYDAVVLGDPQGAGKTFHIHSGEREYFQRLKEQFPGEAAAIDEFRRLVKSAGRGVVLLGILKMLPRFLAGLLIRSRLLPRLCSFSQLASRSLKEVVDGLTPNPELRAVLSYIFPTYGVLPSKASFSMHSILVNHFLHGAWYPKGGAGEIAFHTIPVIRKAGGNVFGKAPVQRILLDAQGRAYGELRPGTGCSPKWGSFRQHLILPPSLDTPGVSVKKGQDSVDIFAPVIISDAGIFNTYERLLPAAARALPEIQAQLSMVTHSEGGFTVFVGLSGSREELGLEPTNYFMFPGNDLDGMMQRYLASSREEAANNIPLLFVTSPSSKDPTWEMRHPGKSTLAIVTFARYEWFEEWKDKQVHKRGDDYEDLKKTFVDAIMQTVLKLYPRIEGRIEYLSGGTPLTNQHYIASPHGEFYGVDHGIPRMQAEAIATVRAETAVPNLYLTGQDLCVEGFMGALQGAMICASTVLKRNLYVDVAWLKMSLQATSSKK
ncbi:RETST reductase, partial [Phainopepla nitens]|nr:RETST reductase [Phainopepla nitens]